MTKTRNNRKETGKSKFKGKRKTLNGGESGTEEEYKGDGIPANPESRGVPKTRGKVKSKKDNDNEESIDEAEAGSDSESDGGSEFISNEGKEGCSMDERTFGQTVHDN
ncbi:hypothetical protein QFC20_007508 [Naganishia adeliensis]|uniref:Uncharacterized protein n=1 Tax=Naganishia adeliensis TaxID=92952 RepID=A0ACC2UY96_9TREE|nr:hypothetical protein QFC20_007508 [Naganishia adeliensis]